ncbi:MAG TPA: transcriptional repressor [Pyrinomonadaceae bacterium]|jgi:Fur family peroxide stress response transcriptional regulator
MSRNKEEQGGVAAGLTPQRDAVLQAIRETDAHLTAGEVFEAARRRLPSISFATVYNSLRYLTEAGLVREINQGKGASRYDRELARHDHAVCTCCGKLVDFDLPETVELMRAAARRSRFKPESIHLTLRGVCPDCREQAGS